MTCWTIDQDGPVIAFVNFTIDGLVLTPDTITNDATLGVVVAAGADIELGDDVVLLTIRGDGTVDINATSLDLLSSATLLNVGVAGQNITATGLAGVAAEASNFWVANFISLQSAQSGSDVLIRARNVSDTADSTASVEAHVGGSSAGDPAFRAVETGSTQMTIGVDVSASIIAWARGGALGTDDIIRVTDASPPVITYNAAHPTGTFDYVCDTCGRHSGEPFSCHRTEAKWHDDMKALIPVLAWANTMGSVRDLRHMESIGVFDLKQSGNEITPWVGINLQAAQWYTWSLQGQMSHRLDEHDTRFSTVEDRAGALEQAVAILTAQVVALG
ncbi:hypothetical protein LCGC14_2950390, partial [marine sediment metagenome]